MGKKSKKQGVVYSTNPDYSYEYEQEATEDTLPPQQQDLRILLDKKQRAGKKVTLVTRFVGNAFDLASLGKELKSACGTGGTVKNGEIIIQGDFRDKIKTYLEKKGYKCKLSGV